MLTLKQIRDNKQFTIERLAVKGFDAERAIGVIEELDDKRKSVQTKLDTLLAEQNSMAREIGTLYSQGKGDQAEGLKERGVEIKEQTAFLDEELKSVSKRLEAEIVELPNIPADIVPLGRTPEDNEIVKTVQDSRPFYEKGLPHWELVKKYDIIDFELGVKLTGAGFPVYKGKGAQLQRALISFFLDRNIEAGYEEVQPPLMVNEASAFGTGQLPDKEGQMYHDTIDNLFLIPTAEVPVTNIFRDVILESGDFPKKLTAYTPCFRREAGSYGKDVRGLNRLHQFDKVEIVRVEHPDNSYKALDEMVAHVESLIAALGLPYRILRLCGGDMSFTSALTYDFEVYSKAQARWLEVSSVSNFESFQANRLKLRYRGEGKRTELAHTLNGSAVALPRIVAALLENYQTESGIDIPEVLIPYTRFDKIE